MKKKFYFLFLLTIFFLSAFSSSSARSTVDTRDAHASISDVAFSNPAPQKSASSLLDMAGVPVSVAPASVLRLADYDAVFTIKNISGEDWLPGEIEFRFTTGSENLKYEGKNVFVSMEETKHMEKVTAIFDMIAPIEKGNHLLTAEVYRNGEFICEISNVLCVW